MHIRFVDTNMSVWWARTSGYRLGVLVCFLGSAFYLIGYAVPFWYGKGQGTGPFLGLWVWCKGPYYPLICHAPGASLGKWFIAVQVVESMGLVAMVVAAVYVVIVNCCKATRQHSRFLEIVSAFSGLCGFVGCMVFVGMIRFREGLGWAFAFSLTGSLLVIIASAIIHCTNRADLDQVLAVRTHGQPAGAGIRSRAVPAQAVPPEMVYDVQTGYGYDQGVPVMAQYPGGFSQVVPSPSQAGGAP